MLNFRVCVSLILILALMLPPRVLADCDITVGDQVMDWVQTQAAEKSRLLANVDLNARAFNLFYKHFEGQHARLQQISAAIDAMVNQIQASEQGLSSDDVAAAISRQVDSQDVLNKLFAIRKDLDDAFVAQRSISSVPSYETFHFQGLDQVGRATLLNSFQEIGSSAEQTLSSRFSFAFGVTINENGTVTGSAQIGQAGPADTIALGICNALQITYFAYLFVKLILFFISNAECERRIEQQKQKIREAFRLLPSKLMTPNDLYSLYRGFWLDHSKQFQSENVKVEALLNLLDRRWRDLVAFNALRTKVSDTVLTGEKLRRLRERYGRDDGVTSIFRSAAIIRLTDQIVAFNSYLARQQTTLIRSCGDVDGFKTAENHLDALAYATEAFSLYRRQPSLAPLHDLLDLSLRKFSTARADADRQINQLPVRRCRSVSKTPIQGLAKLAKTSVAKRESLIRATRLVSEYRSVMPSRAELLSASTLQLNTWQVCALVTQDGRIYHCGGSGTPYSGGFANRTGDPVTDILMSVHDGGYAEDNRRVSTDINTVNQNLQERITATSSRLAAAEQALPEWLSHNADALEAAAHTTQERLNQQVAARDEFSHRNAVALSTAQAITSEFLDSPFDQDRITRFLSSVGGQDTSLSNLAATSIVPDLPTLEGMTAPGRVYGALTGINREIHLEQLRVEQQLPEAGSLRSLALEDLRTASKFAAAGTETANRLAYELLKDSASLRFAQQGRLARISVTTSAPDGTLGRRQIDDPASFPVDSVLAQVRQFSSDEFVFNVRAQSIHAALTPDSPQFARRNDVLNVAESTVRHARSVFDQGEIVEGEKQLNWGTLALDLVTGLPPGIGFARSVYEAISGKDLISGDKLDGPAYALVVFGVVTAGLGEDIRVGIKSVRALEEICDARVARLAKKFGEDVIYVAEGAKNVLPQALDFDAHALERMQQRFRLSEAEGQRIVELGRPFFDSGRTLYDDAVRRLQAGEIERIPKELEDFYNHTGLVYISRLKTIRPTSSVDAVLASAVNANRNLIVTIYELERISSITDEAVESLKVLGEQRFFHLHK